MSLLHRLGLGRSDPPPPTSLMAKIKNELERLPAARAELVAAFAGLLVRVAHADNDISEAERAALQRLVTAHAGLTPAESTIVADIVIHQTRVLAGIDYASLTRIFNEHSTAADKEHLIDCLYAIATADEIVSVIEDEEIRQVSRALILSHPQFIAVRSRYKEKLEVIQAMRREPR
jgi:uncharacterized tellurite resistance protein B-like protein